jgi:hypothetical protein
VLPNYPNVYPPGHAKAGQTHPKAGEPIGDIGHKPGNSWSEYQNNPTNKDKTRSDVIADQNDSKIYHYEDPSSNRSHEFE